MNRYIEEAEFSLDKSVVQSLIKDVYEEACELIMFIITEGKEKEGAYSVVDDDGEQVLYIFEEEDDAMRYSMQLEEMDYP